LILAPTDSARAYLLALSLVIGAGGFALTANFYSRRALLRRARILDVYSGVLAVSLAAGVVALGPAGVVGAPEPIRLALALPAGVLIGLVARRLDRRIVRTAARSQASRLAARDRRLGSLAIEASGATPTQASLLLGGTQRRTPARAAAGRAGAIDPRELSLGTVVVVAIAEELFYRGVLLHAARLAAAWAVPVLVVGTICLFACAHVAFGWSHVLAKAPLGALTAGGVLLLGSILPALIAHVWFNVSVWRDIKATGEVLR
jgi:membrane protease YdiL (CAAX protease family)